MVFFFHLFLSLLKVFSFNTESCFYTNNYNFEVSFRSNVAFLSATKFQPNFLLIFNSKIVYSVFIYKYIKKYKVINKRFAKRQNMQMGPPQ